MKLHVEGMTGRHCVNGPRAAEVTVNGRPDADLLREAIEDEGYDVIGIDDAPGHPH